MSFRLLKVFSNELTPEPRSEVLLIWPEAKRMRMMQSINILTALVMISWTWDFIKCIIISSTNNSIYPSCMGINLNFQFSHKPIDICHHLWPESHFLQLELPIFIFYVGSLLIFPFLFKEQTVSKSPVQLVRYSLFAATDGGSKSREPEIIDGGGTSPEGEFGYGHLNNGPREMVAPPKMQRNRFCWQDVQTLFKLITIGKKLP